MSVGWALSRCALVLVSVVLVVLTLPPFNIGWAALMLLLPLLFVLSQVSMRVGMLFGVCWGALVGAYMYLGVAAYSKPVFGLTLVVVMLVGGVLFVVTALAAQSNRVWLLSCVPFVWVLSEYALNAAGIPYTVAVLMAEHHWLIQPVKFGGPHFLAALVYLLQVILFVALTHRPRPVVATSVSGLAVVAVFVVANVIDNGPAVETITVSAVQTNSHPNGYAYRAADTVLEASIAQRNQLRSEVSREADLVVWPEWAVLGYQFRLTDFNEQVLPAAQLVNAQDLSPAGIRRNLVVGFDEHGVVTSTSGKATLIPFIEQSVSPATEWSVHRGLPGSPLSTVCYESVFANSVAAMVKDGAGLITVLTSDAYAGPSLIPALHARYAALRAVENNRYVVRAANGGVSMLVSNRGIVEQSLPLFGQGVLNGSVAVLNDTTLFTRFAMSWWWGLLVAGVVALVVIAVNTCGRATRVASSASGAGEQVRFHFREVLAVICATSVLLLLMLYGQSRYVSGLLQDSGSAERLKSRYALFFEDAFDSEAFRFQRTRVSDVRESLSAAAAYVLRTYGVATSASEVASVVNAQLRQGRSDLVALERAVSLHGFSLVEQNLDSTRLTMPIIAVMNSGEAVVVTNLAGSKAELFSPVNGSIELDLDYFFERLATRNVVFLAPPARSWDQ